MRLEALSSSFQIVHIRSMTAHSTLKVRFYVSIICFDKAKRNGSAPEHGCSSAPSLSTCPSPGNIAAIQTRASCTRPVHILSTWLFYVCISKHMSKSTAEIEVVIREEIFEVKTLWLCASSVSCSSIGLCNILTVDQFGLIF